MKKLFTAIAIIFLISWQQPKKLKVEADIQTWNAIINVIDLSDAPPKDRVAAKEFILNQLYDTTINKRK